MDDDSVWAAERRLWLEGAEAFEALLHPECLMAFPGMGVMRAAEVMESLKQAPRFSSVEMTDQMIGRAGDAIVLAYTAQGRREGAAPYRCHCTTTYTRAGDGLRLVQHQQTPA